jgi:hypothetical protein
LHFNDTAARPGLPGAYLYLALEVVLWQAGLMAAYVLILRLRGPVHRWTKRFNPDADIDTGPEVTRAISVEALGAVWAVMALTLFGMGSVFTWVLVIAVAVGVYLLRQSADKLPELAVMALGALTAALVAAWVGYFFIRSSETGQIMWSLVLAFAAGGLVAELLFPCRKPALILLSPAIVAVISYVAMSFQFDSGEAILRAWFSLGNNGDLPGGLGFALPIQYVSAGVTGCCVGIGIGRSFTHQAPAGEDDEEAT